MAVLASLVSRFAGVTPWATRLSGRLFSNPFSYLVGKPLERRLLTYELPSGSLVLANDPDVVDSVMLDRSGGFPKSALVYELLRPMIGQGVFGQPGGEAVRRMRRVFIRALARIPDAVVAETARTITAAYFERWIAPHGGNIAVCSELSRLTVDIVSEAALGGRFSEPQSRRFVELFFAYQERAMPLVLLLSRGLAGEARKLVANMGLVEVGAEMRELIRQRFVEPLIAGDTEAHQSPFARALAADGTLAANGASLRTDDALLDQIAVMLLAGHETTASALSWLIWELVSRPVEQEALSRVIADTPDSNLAPAAPGPWSGVTPRNVVDALIKETLRLYPPIAFFLRETSNDVSFREKRIPAGSYMVVSPWTLHRHRRFWEAPDSFEPTRWLKPGGAPADARYIPFGMGARGCPGARFAEIEMQEIVTLLFSQFRFSAVERSRPRPLGSLTSRPDRDFLVRVASRAAAIAPA
jgi:cytochrome P450